MKQPPREEEEVEEVATAEGCCCCTRYFYDISFDVAFHSLSFFSFFFYTFPLLHLRTARSVPLLRRITYSCHRPFPPISFVCRIVTATPATTFRLREASLQSVIDDETHIATIFFGLSFLPAGFLVKRHTTSAMQCICYATVHSSRERTSSTTTTKTRTVLDCCSWEDSHVLRAFRVPPLFF